jgi:hypothetical protein
MHTAKAPAASQQPHHSRPKQHNGGRLSWRPLLPRGQNNSRTEGNVLSPLHRAAHGTHRTVTPAAERPRPTAPPQLRSTPAPNPRSWHRRPALFVFRARSRRRVGGDLVPAGDKELIKIVNVDLGQPLAVRLFFENTDAIPRHLRHFTVVLD